MFKCKWNERILKKQVDCEEVEVSKGGSLILTLHIIKLIVVTNYQKWTNLTLNSDAQQTKWVWEEQSFQMEAILLLVLTLGPIDVMVIPSLPESASFWTILWTKLLINKNLLSETMCMMEFHDTRPDS